MEEFQAKCLKRSQQSKIFILCFSVLWIFLTQISELETSLKSERLEVITEKLVDPFLNNFAEADWDLLLNERDPFILIVCMLLSFFYTHDLQREKLDKVYAYLMDKSLCN